MKRNLEFSDVISFEKLVDGVPLWNNNMHYRKHEDLFLEQHLEMYFDFLLFRSLKYIMVSGKPKIRLKASRIIQNYANIINVNNLKIIDMDREILKTEDKINKSLIFDDNIDLSNKSNAYIVLNKLSECYIKIINDILTEFSREELIKILGSYANTISYISMQTYYWEDKGDIDRNKMNLVAEILHIVHKYKLTDLRFFFGEDKKVLEFLVHYVLNNKSQFKKSTGSRLDIKYLFYMCILLLTVEQQKKYLDYLYKKGGHIVIEQGYFRIEKPYEKDISKYFNSTIDLQVNLHDESLNEIYQLFERSRGYSPFILEEYIFNYDEKFLATNNILSLIEKSALVEDIYRKTGRNRAAICAMLEDLSLSKCSENEYIKQAHSGDNRLFTTPLLNVNNYYLFPFYVFVEASQYFRKRILKGQLSEPLEKNAKRLVESNYDESDLKILENLLLTKKVVGGINFELNKFPQCEKMFKENPSITQEIDFYYIKDNILYLMELKNRSSDYSLFDIAKSLSVTEKHMKLLAGRRRIYLENRIVLSDILGEKFDAIELYLVHKYPTPLDNMYNYEYQISVFTFEEFYKYISTRLS